MASTLEAITSLAATKPRPIIFICGLGGSGKTTFCYQLVEALEIAAVVFQTDLYAKYATQERKQRIADALASGDPTRIAQEENPRHWYDWQALKKDLLALQRTGALEIRGGWNQATGLKDAHESLRLPPDGPGVILVDGIYLLDPGIRPLADLVLLLEAPAPELERRRQQRDGHRSSPEYLRYKQSLAEKYDTPYFARYRSRADQVIGELALM